MKDKDSFFRITRLLPLILMLLMSLGFLGCGKMMQAIMMKTKESDDDKPYGKDWKKTRPVNASDIDVPPGYRIEPFVTGLSFLTDITFGDKGEVYVSECGPHTYGMEPEKAPPARILQVMSDKSIKVVYDKNVPIKIIRNTKSGEKLPEGLIGPIEGITWHNGLIYVAHRTRVSTLNPKTGEFKTIIDDLPAWGFFHNGKVVFDREGKMVFSVSTQGNAGPIDKEWMQVLIPYNKLDKHEIPGEDVTLTGINFPVPVPKKWEDKHETVMTGVFVPFGTTTTAGQVIKGQLICNGGMFRANPDGSNIERIAWGFRNIFGYGFSPDGRLFTTNNNANPIPPREIFNDYETIYEVIEGEWYGWPDFYSGIPVTDPRFSDVHPNFEEAAGRLSFVLTDETREKLLKGKDKPIQPIVKLEPHTAGQGFVFGRKEFGIPENEILLAEFGTVVKYQHNTLPGFRVTRVNLKTGEVKVFIKNKTGLPASAAHGTGGLERPLRLAYGPDGALYIVDWGALEIEPPHATAFPKTAVIWRVVKE
jgi:glucose/arabinose dehydrogenase